MIRPFRSPTLALCALVLSSACMPERGGVPVKPATSPTTPAVAKRPAAPAVPVDPKDSCAAAALTLKPDAVIGKMRGADITAAQLGEDLAAAEHQALRTYCNAVIEARTTMLDNHIQRTLLDELAKAENKSIQEYVQGRIESLVPAPDDAAIQAFYETNKSPETPPLEMVRDQVISAMTGEQRNAALDTMIAEIEGKNDVVRLLPDIALPPVDLSTPSTSPFLGPADAAIQVTEFSDFECPYCSRAAETLTKLKDKYKDASVQFVFRHYPLPMHPNATPAAEYGQCAQAQGKFWPMHDAIFAAQRELSTDKLKELAAQAGLDTAALEACLASGSAAKEVAADLAKGREAGVEGTPSFYINGQPFAGNPNFEGLSKAIDAELAKAQKG